MIRRFCDECGKEMTEGETNYGEKTLEVVIENATTSGKKITARVEVLFDNQKSDHDGGDICKDCLLKTFADEAKKT